MNTLELISSHPDIYDALADIYDIELIGIESIKDLTNMIDSKMKHLDAHLDHYDNGERDDNDPIMYSFNSRIATLAMIKGFIQRIDLLAK